MLAAALVFVILLAEIDLAAGVTAGVAMAVYIQLVKVQGWGLIPAMVAAFAVGLVIGFIIGFMVAKIGVSIFCRNTGIFLGLPGHAAGAPWRRWRLSRRGHKGSGDYESESAEVGWLGDARHLPCSLLCNCRSGIAVAAPRLIW